MSEIQKVSARELVAIGVLSVSIIAFELTLIQILSFVQWYHFAYMVISVALLGFGTAGTALSLWEKWLMARYEKVFPSLFLLTSLSMSSAVAIANLPALKFDTYLLFNNYNHSFRLISTYLLYFIPFFFGALAIGMAYVRYVNSIGKLYFSNLLGSGLGGFFFLILVWQFSPAALPTIISILPLIAGLFLPGRRIKWYSATIASLAFWSILAQLISPSRLMPSQYKDLSKVLFLPETEVITERSSPFGFLQVIRSPHLRYGPGVSLSYADTFPSYPVLLSNGNWQSTILSKKSDSISLLNYTTSHLPYVIRKPNHVLVLDAGAGEQVPHVLLNAVEQVTIVEPNPSIVSLMQGQLASLSDSLFFEPGLTVINRDSRMFLSSDTSRYDLILLPAINSFGGSSGLQALDEQYLFTMEALRLMWSRLTDSGLLVVTSWMDYPIRNPLKILASFNELLVMESVGAADDHLIAVKSWSTISIVLSRRSISGSESQAVMRFCDRLMFDPVILRGMNPDQSDRFNQHQDTLFHRYIENVISSERRSFYQEYDFDIRPVRDNRPYFSQFLKLSRFGDIRKTLGDQTSIFLELGYIIVLLTLIQISVIAIMMILLPLMKLREKIRMRSWTVLYFGGIGVGYMFVEIVLIQQFILFFGNPVYATTAVLGGLLIASGTGSLLSSNIGINGKHLSLWPVMIVATVLALSFFLTPLLQLTISQPAWVKIFVAICIICPLGLVMGFPFPLGITETVRRGGSVPWAWGINSYFSVISVVLATIAAIEQGFSWVLFLGAVAYFIPFLVSFRTRI